MLLNKRIVGLNLFHRVLKEVVLDRKQINVGQFYSHLFILLAEEIIVCIGLIWVDFDALFDLLDCRFKDTTTTSGTELSLLS